MSMSDERSTGDEASEAKAPEAVDPTPTEPTSTGSDAEDRAPEDLDPTTEASPKKRLASGRAAASAVSAGQSLGDVGGVATHRIVSEDPKDGKSAGSGDAAEGQFDPAADMPMYRPGFDWFVLRVASNKESSVRETLLRKVQIEGMEHMVGRIMVPTEKTQSIKAGARRVTETKLYPGYVFVEMSLESDGRIPQDVFFLIKETTGVGDFVGTAGRPTPMATHEVEKMLFDSRKPDETPQVKMEFVSGDAVTIKEGPFENYEGTVDEVMPEKGLVRVLVTIFGRQAPVELEYWQIAKAEE